MVNNFKPGDTYPISDPVPNSPHDGHVATVERVVPADARPCCDDDFVFVKCSCGGEWGFEDREPLDLAGKQFA